VAAAQQVALAASLVAVAVAAVAALV